MKTHEFTLHLEGGGDMDDFTDVLYGDGHDALVTTSNGKTHVGFDREAKSLADAVRSAIESVQRADPTVQIVSVVTDDGRPVSLPDAGAA